MGKSHRVLQKKSGLWKERKIKCDERLSRFGTTAELVHKDGSHTSSKWNMFLSLCCESDTGKLRIFSGLKGFHSGEVLTIQGYATGLFMYGDSGRCAVHITWLESGSMLSPAPELISSVLILYGLCKLLPHGGIVRLPTALDGMWWTESRSTHRKQGLRNTRVAVCQSSSTCHHHWWRWWEERIRGNRNEYYLS